VTVPHLIDKKSKSQNWSKQTELNDWFKIKFWYSHVMLWSKTKYSIGNVEFLSMHNAEHSSYMYSNGTYIALFVFYPPRFQHTFSVLHRFIIFRLDSRVANI